jgi:hypothetical protein
MDPRVTEFQCIMPLENIPSVLKLGILSNERSAKLPQLLSGENRVNIANELS